MQVFLKHTLKAAVFVGGLILILFLLSKVFIPDENTIDDGVHTLNSNGIIGEKEYSIDAIFLGDSEIYASISPLQIWNEYGIPTYCCSTSAQKLWYSQDMLRKAFRKQSPKIVMMETNALFRKFNFDDSIMHRAETVLPVLQYHNRWKVFAQNTFDGREEVTSTNEYKGYKLSYIVKSADESKYMKPSNNVAVIPSRNKSYIKEIKQYCEDHGAKLILFSTPSTVNWNYSRHNAVVKLSKDLGVDYVDLNTAQNEINIDWNKDTRDHGDHLNHFGAVKATSYIGKYLNDLGIFSDKRNDEQYEQWNTVLKKYLKQIKKAAS